MIRALDGSEPHPDYCGWENFLEQCCSVIRTVDGATHYNTSNCNYIVFRDGTLIENFGYHGKALMNRIADLGADAVLCDIRQKRKERTELMAKPW